MHGLRSHLRRSTLTIASLAAVWSALPAVAPTAARAGTASAPSATTGSLIGRVTAPATAGGPPQLLVADVLVTATATDGTAYTTATTANGWYDLERLPASTYTVTAPQRATAATATVPAGGLVTSNLQLPTPVATITGVVSTQRGRRVPGIPVQLSSAAVTACATAPACGAQTTTGPGGRFTLHVPAGGYALQASDAGRPTAARSLTAAAGIIERAPIVLGPPPVPAGTTAERAARDLRRLDAERAADGLPAGLTLSGRWSAECAAHDHYERDNGLLTSAENPDSRGASTGGAWAGLNSDLGETVWTRAADPWENAPIHLLALLAPSLDVVGIDDSAGFQCVTTYPGLVRAPTTSDRIFTYPANGARGVVPSEQAHESPFVPGQFVGIPRGQTAGRELFVYLNLAHVTGQAPVHLLSASLATSGRPVALRWVDAQTPTVGRYLAGAILIPVKPLRPGTRYTATVRVQDRSGTLSHRWSFTTR